MNRTADDGMDAKLSVAIGQALTSLNKHIQRKIPVRILPPGHPSTSSDSASIIAIRAYLSMVQSHPHSELAFVFLSHVAMLDILPLQDRAHGDFFQSLSPDLNRIVHDEFLPWIYNFHYAADIKGVDIIDGRLFGRILWAFTNPESSIDQSDPAIQKAQRLWTQAI